MSVEIDIRYEGNLHCRAVHGPSGEAIETDAPVDNGGRGEAFSPTDLVATGLGTCIMTIMGLAAKRRGFDLSGTHIRAVKDMAADPVRRIGQLSLKITLPQGLSLTPDDRAALEAAVHQCPVRQSLNPNVQVKTEIIWPA